jgi:CHASE3 domain sensor protein
MDAPAEILVIILSIVLAIFLILGIILTIYLIKLSRDIQHITRTASDAVDHINETVEHVSNISSPFYILNAIRRYMKRYDKSRKGGK